MEPKKIFSRNLRAILSDKGMNQSELSKLIGISKPTVSDWANGKKMPRLQKIDRLCEILCVDRDDLLSEYRPYRYSSQNNAPQIAYYGEPEAEESLEDAERLVRFMEKKSITEMLDRMDTESLKRMRAYLKEMERMKNK